MKKRAIIIGSVVAVLIVVVVVIFMINNKTKKDTTDYAEVYCCEEYNAGFGNGGSFSIAVMESIEFEKSFNDLSKLTLGGAFSGMKLGSVCYSELGDRIEFELSGSLSEGDYGTVEGTGLVKDKFVKIDIPITKPLVSSTDNLYDNLDTQQVELELISACFNKNISASDFELGGTAKDMIIENVVTDNTVDDEGNDILPQKAVLTLKGNTLGSDYAYIKILSNATTYNKDLNVSIKTDFCGAHISNDHIDTFTLYDIVYIESDNTTFSNKLSKESIILDGVLKDYAVVEDVDYVDDNLLGVKLSFPYTYLDTANNIGYIKIAADANAMGKELVCSTIVVTPKIESEIELDGNSVKLELIMEHEEFNELSSSQFKVYYPNGNEVAISGTDIIKSDNKLDISFKLPDSFEGLMYFEIKDAYDVIKEDGSKEIISIKNNFYK